MLVPIDSAFLSFIEKYMFLEHICKNHDMSGTNILLFNLKAILSITFNDTTGRIHHDLIEISKLTKQ
jgi:hypothetical protein